MVSDIFETWAREFDRHIQRQQRNVLLFVDNCSAHPKITGLKAIKLEFTPPNTTSVLHTAYGSRYHQMFEVPLQKACSSMHN